MVSRIQAAGVPAALSNTAGTYLCNHVSYGVLHHTVQRGLPVRAGFIHVPYLPEKAADEAVEVASPGLETLVGGLRAAVEGALGSAGMAAVTPARHKRVTTAGL